MRNDHKLLFFIFFLGINIQGFSQSYLGYELGVLVGPVQMRSDFGLREDLETNFGNIGYGVGAMLSLNPIFTGNRRSYILDHFKLRFDVSYSKTNLQHYGKFVDPDKTSDNADKLRNQRGVAKNLDLGAGIEYYFRSLREYHYNYHSFSPYTLFAIQYVTARPDANTTDPDDLYGPWAPGSVNIEPFSTIAFTIGAGFRYKLNAHSDVLVEGKIQFYSSDWIDGLNHQLEYNKHNDSAVWINFGYVYYLN